MSYPPCQAARMINRRNFLQSVSVLLGAAWARTVFGNAVARGEPALLEPPDDAEWDWWRNLRRTPLLASEDPFANALCHAAAARREVTIIYDGGSEPGEPRRIAPLGVFEVEGYRGVYVLAFCLKRGAERTFRLERIVSLA